MAKDAKLDEIELKRTDFNTPEQQEAAERLVEEWPVNFADMEDLYDDYSRSLYQKVYNEYFGPHGDDRTLEEIRSEYGSIKDYKELRSRGAIDLDKREFTGSELKAWKDGFREGWEAAKSD